jgi:glutaredoxin-like YruB-family protein
MEQMLLIAAGSFSTLCLKNRSFRMSSKRVILYSQPGCPPCFAAKNYLKAKHVAFEYKDIQSDPQALGELMDLKSRSTPTLVVGSEVMIGFDPARLDAMLAED